MTSNYKTEAADTAHQQAGTSSRSEKEIEQSNLSSFSDQVEAMNIVSKNVSNIGDSLMNDITSMTMAGEEKLNVLAKETEKALREVPKNVVDYVKTTVGFEEKENNVNYASADEIMDHTTEESSVSKIPEELSSISPMQTIDSNVSNENGKLNMNNKYNHASSENDLSVAKPDESKDSSVDNEAKFMNNAVVVSSPSNIIRAMNDEIIEMNSDAEDKSDELTMKYDGIIHGKEGIPNKMFYMKNGK